MAHRGWRSMAARGRSEGSTMAGRTDGRGVVGWVGEQRGASGDLVEVSSGADPAGDAPSTVRCLPRWLEEWADLDGMKERSRRPLAWSEKSTGWPWGSWRMRWRHTLPKVLSPRGGALAAVKTGSARCLMTLRGGRGKRRQAASGLLHGDGLRRAQPGGSEAALTDVVVRSRRCRAFTRWGMEIFSLRCSTAARRRRARRCAALSFKRRDGGWHGGTSGMC
jgi:hypothetical protein